MGTLHGNEMSACIWCTRNGRALEHDYCFFVSTALKSKMK